ncbi:Response regulator receiver domain-containing protein [Flavobacterium hercynium]|nr:Response regulator receiver domain-containing protein [Flavobacterium hercynium]
MQRVVLFVTLLQILEKRLMNKTGPIIIIEDDQDDQDFLADVFQGLQYKNEIIFFSDGEQALDYLTKTTIEPFIIFSDINMPKLNGIELRAKVHENEDLRMKSIPYLFFSTVAEQQHVVDAYSKSVQGFFVKPSDFNKMKDMIKNIVEYWQNCVSPNYIK